jgi:hypothetical protein
MRATIAGVGTGAWRVGVAAGARGLVFSKKKCFVMAAIPLVVKLEVMAYSITVELNPTPPKTSDDVYFEPALVGALE